MLILKFLNLLQYLLLFLFSANRKKFRNVKPEDDGSPQHGRSGAILDQYSNQGGNLGMGEEFDFGEFGGGGKDGEEEKDMGGFDDFGYLDAVRIPKHDFHNYY